MNAFELAARRLGTINWEPVFRPLAQKRKEPDKKNSCWIPKREFKDYCKTDKIKRGREI